MPYESNRDLPQDVQDALPDHGEEIYREAFNSAMDQYDDESRAHATAWAAVKNVYHKNDDGKWVRNKD